MEAKFEVIEINANPMMIGIFLWTLISIAENRSLEAWKKELDDGSLTKYMKRYKSTFAKDGEKKMAHICLSIVAAMKAFSEDDQELKIILTMMSEMISNISEGVFAEEGPMMKGKK